MCNSELFRTSVSCLSFHMKTLHCGGYHSVSTVLQMKKLKTHSYKKKKKSDNNRGVKVHKHHSHSTVDTQFIYVP